MKALWTLLLASSLSGMAAAQTGAYGAIAMNKNNGHFGWSVGQVSSQAAEQVALQNCSGPCNPMVWWAHGCGALVRGGNRSYATGIAPSRSAAERQALGRCPAGPCVVVLSRCSGNAR
ncbi:DUF4189 domain-containing protein [Inhella proteolytica]|uniref:DUF4189 domain-containing protein n=1 Tax=Inhella proteolytica TaxID=2795029 RepID=A0A931NK27_9BURK|nr:DUF4189 domain-containing protein [Inhella proteolytica]MBH9579260.1 DUF4189 domain-containing protein [Inhella proteolytica]